MDPKSTYYPVPSGRSLPATSQAPGDKRASFPVLYSLGMNKAIEASEYFLGASICVNASMVDIYRHFFWHPLGPAYWFEAQNKAFVSCIHLGLQWMKYSAERRRLPRPKHELTTAEITVKFGKRKEDGVAFFAAGPAGPGTVPAPEIIPKCGRRLSDGFDVVTGGSKVAC